MMGPGKYFFKTPLQKTSIFFDLLYKNFLKGTLLIFKLTTWFDKKNLNLNLSTFNKSLHKIIIINF